jgi:formate hydrogenlyase transcriptional activator
MSFKPANPKLLKDEDELKRIIDLIPHQILVLDAGGTAIFVNQPVLEYTGLSVDEVSAGNFRAHALHPEDVERLREERTKALDAGIPFQNEQRVLRRDGKYRWFQIRYNPLLDERGRATRWYCTATEIEGRKQADDELRRSERDLHEAQSLSHTGSWKLDLVSGGFAITPELGRMFGIKTDDIVNREFFFTKFHPEDRKPAEELLERSVTQKTDFETDYRMILPDGMVRHHHTVGHAVVNEAGELVAFIGTTVDNTEQWQAKAELERALEELGRSERDLHEAQRLSHTGNWKYDILSETITLSPQMGRIFGVNPGDHTSGTEYFFNKFHPEDRRRVEKLFERGVVEKTDFQADYRIVLPDGTIRHLHTVGHPVTGDSGELAEFFGTTVDVTETSEAKVELERALEEIKQAEEKLRKNERELRRVLDTIPALVWSYLPDGSFGFINQRWLDYSGLSPEEAAGFGWQRAVHPEDLPRVLEVWNQARALGEAGQVEARMRRHDGTHRWFLIRTEPLRDEAGKIVRWYGTNTDIEERKQAEEKLRQDERELRLIVDVIPQMVGVYNVEGNPIYANQHALDYLGLTIESATRPDLFSRVIHRDDLERLHNLRQQELLRGDPFETELRARRKDGQYRWFLVRYNPFRDEQGRVTRWYCTSTDIEERKRAEDRIRNENLALREQVDRDSMFEDIVGSSEVLRKVLRQVSKVAPSDSTVLILGETGTGKELVARAIHKRSARSDRAFIAVNCAAIPPSLIASELFGHEKGAFTGAMQQRVGRFESANGGTIFLDEVGDLPPDIQIALLRVLQEREIERVGSNRPIPLDVRVLAATHRDLDALVAEGKFREDLLYRLSVVPIHIPPLRDRADDVPVLVDYFIGRFGKKAGKKFRTIEKRTAELFDAYQWPGNIRELQNVIERAVILNEGEVFSVDETWLKRQPPRSARPTVALDGALKRQEKEMIEAALAESGGRVAGPDGAAAKLGIPRPTLDARIRRLGIDKYHFKSQRPN